jgi:hypothetical protein
MVRSRQGNIEMAGALKQYTKSNPMKFILTIILLSLLSCKKENLDARIIATGTKCTIKTGVFSTGDKQPAQPVVIDGVYSQPNNALVYNVTDSQGVAWEIPDADLIVAN